MLEGATTRMLVLVGLAAATPACASTADAVRRTPAVAFSTDSEDLGTGSCALLDAPGVAAPQGRPGALPAGVGPLDGARASTPIVRAIDGRRVLFVWNETPVEGGERARAVAVRVDGAAATTGRGLVSFVAPDFGGIDAGAANVLQALEREGRLACSP